jgi:hypothetical protein
MSEARQPNVFYSGDEIRLRLSYTHAGTFFAVEVVYVHVEHESYTLTLSGNPEREEGSAATGDERHSTVVVSEEVDVTHIPGRYKIARVLFYQPSGEVYGIGAPGVVGPTPLIETAPDVAADLVQQPTLGGNWPEIEIRPHSAYVEITRV